MKLASEYKELIEYKIRIVRDFEVAFNYYEYDAWKSSEACIQLQGIMNKIRSDIKLNQVKSRYYKTMYKSVQRLKMAK